MESLQRESSADVTSSARSAVEANSEEGRLEMGRRGAAHKSHVCFAFPLSSLRGLK